MWLNSLKFILLATLLKSSSAHRSLPGAITCGPQFGSPDTPLVIPNTKISWANYGIYTCEDPITWFEADADEDQELKFTVTVPVLDRFEDVRMTVVIIGPGLPTLPNDDNVPNSVRKYAGDNNFGGLIYKSPLNQSTCDHLTSPEMIKESFVEDGRCFFYEPFSDTNNWVIMDEILNVGDIPIVEGGKQAKTPKGGKNRHLKKNEPSLKSKQSKASTSYKIAFYEEYGTTAKATFACCEWPEDFITPYPIPESECPACGSTDPSWIYLFYETKDMAQYGGFPALEICPADPGPTEYPSGDECPPDKDSDDPEQPESCNLGCSMDGECHSHNALGGCTHLLDWELPSPKFGFADVNNVIIFKGDTIRFTNPTPNTADYNLYELPEARNAYELCDFLDSTEVANVVEIKIGYDITFDESGTFYYSSNIDGQCELGLKIAVEVKDATEGLRCHDHEESDPYSPPDCSGPGLINARAVNNPDYGAMNENECADFCVFEAVIGLTDAEAGICGDIGYRNNPTPKNVQPPGSPFEVEVVVVSNQAESVCHCHSYEEIPCPEDETPQDTIYQEHIDEIETYCTGILDGTEEVCPYKCFQPIEVLHLHYLECPSRPVDETFEAVYETNLCHIAAPSPDGDDGCTNFLHRKLLRRSFKTGN